MSKAFVLGPAGAAMLAVVTCFTASPGHAAGWRHEPWCAVIEYDDVTWDCSYRSFADCYQNVIAGNKGSCNPNPDGPASATSQTAANHHQRKRPIPH